MDLAIRSSSATFSGAMRKLMMRGVLIIQKNTPYYTILQRFGAAGSSAISEGNAQTAGGKAIRKARRKSGETDVAGFYSSRKATMGSIRAARRAGIQLAIIAMPAMNAVIEPNTSGSFGLTP